MSKLASEIAATLEPPYYAVIFTSLLSADDSDYAATADRMVELAAEQDGFLGIESAREGVGITVSYWSDLESIQHWRQNAEHKLAQAQGYGRWYSSFRVRVCKVEREYGK